MSYTFSKEVKTLFKKKPLGCSVTPGMQSYSIFIILYLNKEFEKKEDKNGVQYAQKPFDKSTYVK